MASGTTGQYVGFLNVILSEQFFPSGKFIRAAVLGSPLHVENLFPGPHKPLGFAMTVKTPFHL